MNTTKQFHLGDILSITTGCLVSPRLMEGVYDILNHMTGDNLFTHQLPRALKECRPFLLQQFPELSTVTGEDITEENHERWLAVMVESLGEWFDVEPLKNGEHQVIDPIAELGTMVPAEKIVVGVTRS